MFLVFGIESYSAPILHFLIVFVPAGLASLLFHIGLFDMSEGKVGEDDAYETDDYKDTGDDQPGEEEVGVLGTECLCFGLDGVTDGFVGGLGNHQGL